MSLAKQRRRKLVLVTADNLAKDSLSSELSHILDEIGESVELESRSMADLGAKPQADLFLLSTPGIVQSILESWGDLNCPFLVCRRSIDHHQIKKLLEIPEGTKVLLVILFEQDALALQQLLEDAGITHLQYIPWSPGNPVPEDILYAVTPGKPHVTPANIPHVIDIGTRTIDITTIIEILFRFEMLDHNADKLSTRLTKELVDLYREIQQESVAVRTDRAILREILNEVMEGVALVSDSGKVTMHNQKFLELSETVRQKDQPALHPHANFFSWAGISTGIRNHLLKGERSQVLVSLSTLTSETSKYLVFLRDATEISKLQQEVYEQLAEQGHIARYTINHIISASKRMKETKELALKISRANGSVLLLGESGVGKELLAQAIHNASDRAHRPFVAVNFSALSETLMESELFGYEEGAFTGAKKGGKIGLLEVANGGTIFLDEIGDASIAIQVRLLRALQERQIIRVGGTKVRNLDIRVIAATHRDIEKQVNNGMFRRDLYYRLAVFQLEIPPLRERKEDIFPLFLNFLGDTREYQLDPKLRYWLTNYPWYGNVRELQNCALYMKGIAQDEIAFEHLPPTVKKTFTTMNMDEPPLERPLSLDNSKTLVSLHGDNSCIGLLDTAPIYREILSRIEENQVVTGMGIGRRSLASKITCFNITGEQLRSRLKVLQSFGMVEVSKGRRGTTITKRGLKYLHMGIGE